jgi:phospholipid/cholesterol/gamma-HCH transport system substrate-binding protein
MAKFSRETKIGLLAAGALALGIWGFTFLKGRNLLVPTQTFYVRYDKVDQLMPSAPVMINGLEVGTVKEMYIDPNDGRTIITVLDVSRKVNVPKNTIATIVGTGLMGGKAIELNYLRPCSGDDCAESGSYLQGDSESFLETMIGDPAELDRYTDRLRIGLTTMYDSLTNPNDPQGFGRTLLAMEETMRQTSALTRKLNTMLDASASSFSATARNTAEITNAIRANNRNIEATLANLAAVSGQLKAAGIDQTTARATQAIDSLALVLSSMRRTLNNAERSLANVDTLTATLIHGEGLFNQLANDRELYTNLVRTTRHLHLLLQDVRLNPRRYNSVKIKLFGGNKVKEYKVPMDDPAYRMMLDSIEREYSRRMDSVEVTTEPRRVKG